jgi:hypothetical protein
MRHRGPAFEMHLPSRAARATSRLRSMRLISFMSISECSAEAGARLLTSMVDLGPTAP